MQALKRTIADLLEKNQTSETRNKQLQDQVQQQQAELLKLQSEGLRNRTAAASSSTANASASQSSMSAADKEKEREQKNALLASVLKEEQSGVSVAYWQVGLIALLFFVMGRIFSS